MNYTATAAKAAAMIRKAGMSMTLRVSSKTHTPSTGTVVEGTPTDYSFVGLLKNPGWRDSGLTFADGSLIKTSDKSVLIAADDLEVTPAPGNLIIISEGEWIVTLVKTTNPGGVDLLHTCYIRRA